MLLYIFINEFFPVKIIGEKMVTLPFCNFVGIALILFTLSNEGSLVNGFIQDNVDGFLKGI